VTVGDAARRRTARLLEYLDYVTPTEDGTVVVNLSALTRDQGSCHQDVTIEQSMDGKGGDARPVRRIKFKLHDKKGPLEMLGRRLRPSLPPRAEPHQSRTTAVSRRNRPSDRFAFAAADRELSNGGIPKR
jgi:hypothetical protein